MKVIVTGGCGYIGSKVVYKLLSSGYQVVVIDDLSMSTMESIEGLNIKFYQCDIRNMDKMNMIFQVHSDAHLVMDFAARLIVGESVINPELYYDVNVIGLKVVLDMVAKYKISSFIFSSTAAVHGLLDKGNKLINEEDPTIPCNPYGNSKLIGELMIKDYSKKNNFNYIIFRYFNVVGGIKKGSKLSELTTVVPKVVDAADKNVPMVIFGNNYNTADGTCIRDFIHVEDLAQAHINVIGKINQKNSGIYNLSIGKGTSVLELINLSEQKLNKSVPFIIGDRREGDPVISAASNEKYLSNFEWNIQYTDIGEMVLETYNSWLEYMHGKGDK